MLLEKKNILLKQNNKIVTLEAKNTKCEFLHTGDVYQFVNNDILINQRLGNAMDGSINNIYLRVYENGVKRAMPLLGIKSNSTFSYGENKVSWCGEELGVKYKVTFTLADENIWFWSVELEGNNKIVDIIYGQDISISSKGATLTNELYMSQYLDNKILEGEYGVVVGSRQNQSQGGLFPYLQQGSLNTEIEKFSTDAMQFFGKEYRLTNTPIALENDLENRNYQFELSYTALQTKKISLNGKENIVFYGVFKETHEDAVTKIEFLEEVKEAYENIKNKEELESVKAEFKNTNSELISIEKIKIKEEFKEVLTSRVFTKEDINRYFSATTMEEYEDGNLLSFFTNEHSHVALQEKELMVERPHGHIISSGVSDKHLKQKLISTSNFMYGVFNAQIIVGNTSHNKMLSVHRGLLNTFKNSGQRIYVKIDSKFKLLTMPAAYELGMNYSKWYYKLDNDTLIITSYAACENADLILEVKSENNLKYEFLITNQLVMGCNEFEQDVIINVEDSEIEIHPQSETLLTTVHPEIRYDMHIQNTAFEISDDKIFFEDNQSRNATLMTIKTEEIESFKIVIQGIAGDATEHEVLDYKLEEEKEKFNELYKKMTCGFKLSLDKEDKHIDKINETFWWYTHNAMVHYSTPRGLEQTGGAAWGTRDVCQGPIEYFLATQHYDLTREILVKIFTNQFLENGEWPQWFMFDEYNMQQDDCHGDVVFWPIKAVGDYINMTGDYSILDEEIPYKSIKSKEYVQVESLLNHIKLAIRSIEERFLNDMALISYGGGDWDDTLQPANKDLKERLVSSWTMALAYQSIKQIGEIIENRDETYGKKIIKMASEIKDVFNAELIKDEVIPGFAYCNEDSTIDYMLHPSDTKTGIQYRLLPMTRSIISELVNKEQADKNISLIDEHLKCPDGVRLMNRPAEYNGGTIRFFQRAEQAANVGREVGLQYVHAHIRYIEAMAKLGKSKEAWNGLFVINPINIKDEVKNAQIRQSNTYFSSSEGAFDNRYEFQDNFNKLRSGDVKVKGGWRIYSSGPGIYLNQLVSNVLGFRIEKDSIEIDPILPMDLDGLNFEYSYKDSSVKFVYNIKTNDGIVKNISINKNEIEFDRISNPYRQGGAKINKELFEKYLSENSVIEILI